MQAVKALIDQDLNLLAGGPRGRHGPGAPGGPEGADRDSGYGQRVSPRSSFRGLPSECDLI